MPDNPVLNKEKAEDARDVIERELERKEHDRVKKEKKDIDKEIEKDRPERGGRSSPPA